MTDTLTRNRDTNNPGHPTQFAAHNRTEADTTLTIAVPAERLRSDFIDGDVTTQEAAIAYQMRYPEATAEDVENDLFDTWDTVEDFEHDVANPDSEIRIMGDSAVVDYLPSGGVAVFWG